MSKKLDIALALICFFFVISKGLPAYENPKSWRFSSYYQYNRPVGSFTNWFSATPISFSLALGKETGTGWCWEAKVDLIQYRHENKEKLFYKDLELVLDLYGVCAQANYALIQKVATFRPFLTGGAGFYRWFARRCSYPLEERIVPGRDQNDWSGGFNVGFGMNLFCGQHLALSLNCRYQFIIGELWPALALRLENVSGFQSLSGGLGILIYF